MQIYLEMGSCQSSNLTHLCGSIAIYQLIIISICFINSFFTRWKNLKQSNLSQHACTYTQLKENPDWWYLNFKVGHKLLDSKVSENTLCSNHKRATQTEKCFRKTSRKVFCRDKQHLCQTRKELFSVGEKKRIAHKELLTGLMLIAFKSQLTGSAVIRVPLQDVKYTLFKHISPI